MPLMLIIADDLTGAADCGVACAGHGLRTLVVLGDSGAELNAGVLAVDADTRRLSPELAAAETARLLRMYLRSDETIVYKKFDSTLRGNVGEELAAVLGTCRELVRTHERTVVVLAPAFPAAGRTTVNGRQFVNGEPLEQSRQGKGQHTDFGSDISSMLRAAHLRPAPLGLDLIRGDGPSLRDSMSRKARDCDVLVCDAETDDDLRRIAEASMALGNGTVWAGSAGLAWQLPPATGSVRPRLAPRRQTSAAGPVLFVVGSGSDISRKQVETLAAGSDTIVMRIPCDVLLSGMESPQWKAYGMQMELALKLGRDLAVLPDSDALLDPANGPQFTAALAAMVKPLADKAGALVTTGGETARAVFEAWGIDSLLLVGEVEAGLPFSVTSGWRRELPVLTKAGGFGKAESLLRCRQFLREPDHGEVAHPRTNKGLG